MNNNTWPGGVRRPISQTEHDEWNRINYPGTRQMCEVCDGETGRTEDSSLKNDDGLVVCRSCFDDQEDGK